MWCVPKLDNEYIERMEDVLDTYEKPLNKAEPVVCLDERPVQLHGSVRQALAMKAGKVLREDYEYKRHGTANVFCIFEPKAGKHMTHATENRKADNYAYAIEKISKAYPNVRTIHLVQDNLSTHTENSLIKTFGEKKARRIWSRFTLHYTPKHASWLDQAEIEASLWSRQCLGKQRIDNFDELKSKTNAWNDQANKSKIRVNWRFTSHKAQHSFKYSSLVTPREKH